MRPTIDWKECLKDSPAFRAALEDAEEDMDSLEVDFEKLLKQCDWMRETGKTFSSANSAFISSLRDVMPHFKDDCFVLEALGKFSQTLLDWQNFHNMMLEQCTGCFIQNINNFIKSDIRRVKDSRKQFRRLADEMDGAVCRSAQAPRSKPEDCEEVSSQLDAMRHNFMHLSLQHVLDINLAQLRKRVDLLNAMFSYIQTQGKFVRQGFELFANLEPFNQKLKSELDDLYRKATAEKCHMTEKHKALLSGDFSLHNLCHDQSAPSETNMEGYLFKRTSNAFKTWVRRWFVVENNQLLYCSRQRSKESMTVIEKDLRLCNVKPCYDVDRRFCFQVTSPLRCHVLQADSDADCQQWMSAIQDGASKAYNKTINQNSSEMHLEETSISSRFSAQSISLNSSKESLQVTSGQSQHVLRILSVVGNSACCDCGLKDPRWTSINFGITLCIECSGVHRSFGVHKSKVRSLTLDAWDEDHVKLMTQLGNTFVNQVFEAVVGDNVQRAHPGCSGAVREAWIAAKYIQKAFVQHHTSSLSRLAVPPDASIRRGRDFAVLGSSPSYSNVHRLSCVQKATMKQVSSQDSGLGGSNDVILCTLNASDQSSSLGLEDSHSAMSDFELDPEVPLTVSADDASELSASSLLSRAAAAGSIPEMLRALALGGNPNWNCKAEEGKTPLIYAIESGNSLAMEFLLLNGAKTDVMDEFGRTPLHHATILRRTTHVCQLIKRNANRHLTDINGQNALDIAIENMDANIVTLLRLARLNDEMKESDDMYDMQEEVFSEVFKDFGNLGNMS